MRGVRLLELIGSNFHTFLLCPLSNSFDWSIVERTAWCLARKCFCSWLKCGNMGSSVLFLSYNNHLTHCFTYYTVSQSLTRINPVSLLESAVFSNSVEQFWNSYGHLKRERQQWKPTRTGQFGIFSWSSAHGIHCFLSAPIPRSQDDPRFPNFFLWVSEGKKPWNTIEGWLKKV